MLKPVVLVACGSQKLPYAAAAQDLYTGDLFVKSRARAERFGSSWFILSAKHGLVLPGQVIDPYDLTLNAMKSGELADWEAMVRAQTAAKGIDLGYQAVVVLAGRRYRRWCEHLPNVSVPMKGLGIDQQKGWLRAQLAA